MDRYTLKCGLWEAECFPRWGMNTMILRHDGKDILRCPQSEDALLTSPIGPLVYGQPLLMPANLTEDGCFTFEGTQYRLPITEHWNNCNLHGQLYMTPFTVVAHTETKIVGELRNGVLFYPFPFRLRITDELTEQGYTRTAVLENTGKTPMPYTLAFHTTFVAPDKLTLPVKAKVIYNERDLPVGSVPVEGFKEAHITGDLSDYFVSEGHTAILDDVVYSVSENFDHWITYNDGGGKGFLCVEPQCGAVNGLNTPGGHRVLQPGERETFIMTIQKRTDSL